MSPRIEFARPLADFDAIYDYIARDNPTAVAEALPGVDRFN
jgi:plasmid stabilization system protein ParE